MDDYREEVKAVVDALVLPMPGVVGGRAFGYPAYKVNRKMFMFVGGAGIGIKLGEARAAAVVAAHPAAALFQPVEGTTWKAWVSIDHADPAHYRDDIDLIEEAMQFVAS
ncbi:MAG: hypothetical protein ACOCXZ_00090 [Chloroflexota bacterium]